MSDAKLRDAAARLGFDSRDWRATEPSHNQALTAGIWILSNGERRMVIKRVASLRSPGDTPFSAHWVHGTDVPTRWNYWAREALVYENPFLASFDEAGIRAPRCLGVDIRADDAVFAIEYVEGTAAEHWDIPTYAAAARALGGAQASLAGAVQNVPWLSTDFLHSYSSEKPVRWEMLHDEAAWAQPLVAENFPDGLRGAAVELHERRSELYALMKSLPRTLCHLDFWTKNLIKARDGGFVLLDWAFVGDGAIGEDVGNLVPDAAFDHFIEPEQLPSMRAAVLTGYLAGLRSGGWNGSDREVEQAMAASAIKYDWLTPLMLERASDAEHRRYGGVDTIEPSELYRKRGVALLDNALQGLSVLAS